MRRPYLIVLLFGAAAIALLSVPTVASAATCTPAIGPAVTLTSPANGSLISGGQPTFAGCASTGIDASPQVTVRVYAGASASGTPVHTLTTTPGADGGYSAGVSSPLADGQYTAQAEQDGILGLDNAFSNTSTFEVHNAAPTITLDSPGTKPLLTATPTLTGTAGHAIGDSSTVNVTVYPGAKAMQSDDAGHTAVTPPHVPDRPRADRDRADRHPVPQGSADDEGVDRVSRPERPDVYWERAGSHFRELRAGQERALGSVARGLRPREHPGGQDAPGRTRGQR